MPGKKQDLTPAGAVGGTMASNRVMLPGYHVPRRQPRLIAPDEFRGDGEHGRGSRPNGW